MVGHVINTSTKFEDPKRNQKLPGRVTGRSVRAKISGGKGRPWGIFLGFCKTRHILLFDSANCTVLRDVVLTQRRCATDGQTGGIAVASIALAKRRAVMNDFPSSQNGKSVTHSIAYILT